MGARGSSEWMPRFLLLRVSRGNVLRSATASLQLPRAQVLPLFLGGRMGLVLLGRVRPYIEARLCIPSRSYTGHCWAIAMAMRERVVREYSRAKRIQALWWGKSDP